MLNDPAIVKAQPTRAAAPSGPGAAAAAAATGSAKPHKQAPPAPKPPATFPTTATLVQKKEAPAPATPAEGEEAAAAPAPASPTFVVDWKKMMVIHCADDTYVAMPRAAALKLPATAKAAAAVGDAEKPTEKIAFIGHALVAANHWAEHCGGPTGKATSPFPGKVAHTEFETLLQTEWERDFANRILAKGDGTETLFGTLQLAEKTGMPGLLEFCLIAVSCAVRGKTNHEMALALGCHDVDEFSPEQLAAGKATYKWVDSVLTPKAEDDA